MTVVDGPKTWGNPGISDINAHIPRRHLVRTSKKGCTPPWYQNSEGVKETQASRDHTPVWIVRARYQNAMHRGMM